MSKISEEKSKLNIHEKKCKENDREIKNTELKW